jgi:hypothetical protein
VAPLSPLETAAVRSGDLGEAAEGLTTLAGQVAQMPHPPEEQADGRLSRVYRIVGAFEEIYAIITMIPWRTVARSENVLVGEVGRAGSTDTARGHEQMVRVVPLNRAAVRLFEGTRPRAVRRALLEEVRARDVRD